MHEDAFHRIAESEVGTAPYCELLLRKEDCGHTIFSVSGFKDASRLGRADVSSKVQAATRE